MDFGNFIVDVIKGPFFLEFCQASLPYLSQLLELLPTCR